MEDILKKYKRGDKMNIVEITPQSVGDLKQVLQDQDITQNSLRISVNIGWGGSAFYLALDEPNANDLTQEVSDLTFVIDRKLQEIYQGFTIESVKNGPRTLFRIVPKVEDQFGGGCGSCTSC